jgi:hypothetical protein
MQRMGGARPADHQQKGMPLLQFCNQAVWAPRIQNVLNGGSTLQNLILFITNIKWDSLTKQFMFYFVTFCGSPLYCLAVFADSCKSEKPVLHPRTPPPLVLKYRIVK